MKQEIVNLLNDIEERIDPEIEDDYNRQWEDFLNNKFCGDIFTPQRKKLSPPKVKLNRIFINDAIDDYELMFLKEVQGVSYSLNSPSGTLSVRSNYGTGILSSLFGLDVFMMPYEMDTLPTTIPLNDTETLKNIVHKNNINIKDGLGGKVFVMGELFKEEFSKYPKINKYVEIYHPDLQGPLDVCELVWGSQIFYELYDNPELVHDVLALICDVYTEFMNKWFAMTSKPKEINTHWSMKHKGAIMIRDDSAMNLSPEMYEEFGYRYDNLLLERFDGGAVHFCGRGDHYIETLTRAEKLTAINMSQPHLNDMEKIYNSTVLSPKNIKLIGFSRQQAENDMKSVKYHGTRGAFNGNIHS
jgi:hypothetical protein